MRSEDPWGIPNNISSNICKNCGFSNQPGSLICEVCKESLAEKKKASNLQIVRTRRNLKLSKLKQTTDKVFVSLAKVHEKAEKQILVSNFSFLLYKKLRQLSQPSNLLGILVFGIGLSLWGNYLLINPQIEQAKTENKVNSSLSSAPIGLFDYGGTPIYASLASKGFFNSLEVKNPGMELRFSKPLDQDYSNTNGIKKLIDKDISFAFTNRALTDKEFKRANTRNNLKLAYSKIALDGVVFFGNINNSVSALNVKQIKDILTGEITNWNQISPKAKDLPIVLVILENEDLSEFGIQSSEIAQTAEFLPNHTQAVRRVIATPGSISFSSASLAANQKLIKGFAIAEGDSKTYIPGLVGGRSNIKAFRDETYPLTRSVFISHRDDSSPGGQAGKIVIDFANSESGQQIIETAGLVPLGQTDK